METILKILLLFFMYICSINTDWLAANQRCAEKSLGGTVHHLAVLVPYQKIHSDQTMKVKFKLHPVFLPGESCGETSLMGCCHGLAQSRTQLK